MRDRDNFAFFAGLLTLLLVVLLIFLVSRGQQDGAGTRAPERSAKPRSSSQPVECGQALQRCTAEVTVKTHDCDEPSVRRLLEGQLRDPLTVPGCDQAEQSLAAACGEGCVLEQGTLLSVPGKVAVDFSPQKDESGRCLARGKRSLTMRASCVPG